MAKRIFIVGGPDTGKSSLAGELATKHGIKTVRATDALIPMGWSQASDEIAKWIDDPGDQIIEGAATVRGLRKWLNANPGKQFDGETSVYVLTQAHEPQTKGQITMTRAIYTVLTEIYGELHQRGAVFERQASDGDKSI